MQRWVEARDAAARFGQVGYARFFSGQSDYALILGDWDRALAASDAFLGGVGSRPAHYLDPMCYLTRAVIRLGRGDTAGAELDAARGLETSDVALDPQNRAFAVAMGAHVVVETGNIVRAEPLFDEFLAILRTHDGRLGFGTVTLHVIAWTAVALRREHDLTDAIIDLDNPWALASRCFASGDAAAAAEVLGRMGARTEEAYDRLWLARRLAEQGRRSEADQQLRRALAFFREVKATRYTREGEALLAASA
jgi:tetratricopeptide (TPR) repeat protein